MQTVQSIFGYGENNTKTIDLMHIRLNPRCRIDYPTHNGDKKLSRENSVITVKLLIKSSIVLEYPTHLLSGQAQRVIWLAAFFHKAAPKYTVLAEETEKYIRISYSKEIEEISNVKLASEIYQSVREIHKNRLNKLIDMIKHKKERE